MASEKTRTVLKKGPNFVRYDDGSIRLDNVIISYPHFFEAYAGDEKAKPAYSCTAMLPKKTHVAAKNAVKEMIQELLAKNNKKLELPPDKICLRDGSKSGKEQYQGFFTVSARSQSRPKLRKRNKQPLTEKDEEIYGGVVGNLLINVWWQSNKYGKRINGGLLGFQYMAEGDRLGEGGLSEDAIDESFDDQEDPLGPDDDEDDGDL